MVEKLFQDLFLKIQKTKQIFLINSITFYTVFLFFSGLEQLKLSFRPLTFISFISFSAWFFKKNISITMFSYQNKFYCLFAFTSWDIGQYMYCNCLLTRLRRHKFWYQTVFSNQAVFSTRPKSQDKDVNILRTKIAFKVK